MAETKPKRSPAYNQFKTVRELRPNRFPGHKLTAENALNGVVPGEMGCIEELQFFRTYGWTMRDGWVLRGWATPPYRAESNDAIVFEKLVPADMTTGQYFDSREPGIYWLHGNASTMKFFAV